MELSVKKRLAFEKLTDLVGDELAGVLGDQAQHEDAVMAQVLGGEARRLQFRLAVEPVERV